jgi:3-hydroxymyristoyl/3-hydroxydecanoyl-(acyl carrier protein) dehydratase
MKDFYTILDQTPTKISIKFASKKHKLFLAHFHNNPIVAGFLQLDILTQILKHNIKKIIYIKFLQSLKPLDIVVYHIKESKHETFFEIKRDNHTTTKAKYERF